MTDDTRRLAVHNDTEYRLNQQIQEEIDIPLTVLSDMPFNQRLEVAIDMLESTPESVEAEQQAEHRTPAQGGEGQPILKQAEGMVRTAGNRERMR